MTANHCHFFVQRKNRFCRMTVKNDSKYCGEHLRSDDNYYQKVLAENERVQCPLDSTHTCYKSKLLLHLKKCNAKRKLEPKPYIKKDYNVESSAVNLFQTPLSQIDQSIINEVIKKVNKAYESLPTISEQILSHDVLKEELQNPEYGNTTRKHLLQNASLLEHLNQANLLANDTCFIDFGAGKGKLTYWLAQIVKDQKDSSILLIDRSSLRHKMDNKLKCDYSIKVERIRADIADLKLSGLQEFTSKSRKVAVAKHLCGIATDLALRCLANAMHEEPQQIIQGIVIAFCCHHRCEYNSYVGNEFLEKNGFSAKEFPILCSIATWATCGLDKQIKTPNDNEIWKEKECIGRKVKNLLNWGRVEFLRKLQFNCRLVQYVSLDVSLENTCIIAVRNTDSV